MIPVTWTRQAEAVKRALLERDPDYYTQVANCAQSIALDRARDAGEPQATVGFDDLLAATLLAGWAELFPEVGP